MLRHNFARPGTNYWGATDEVIQQNGGANPLCPNCGRPMTPEDDHGNFVCFTADCSSGGSHGVAEIPQIPTSVKLSDADKEKIPPLNRLHHTPTEKEQEILRGLLAGMSRLSARKKPSKPPKR